MCVCVFRRKVNQSISRTRASLHQIKTQIKQKEEDIALRTCFSIDIISMK